MPISWLFFISVQDIIASLPYTDWYIFVCGVDEGFVHDSWIILEFCDVILLVLNFVVCGESLLRFHSIFDLSLLTSERYFELASPNFWDWIVDNVIFKFLIYDIDVF